MPDRRVDEHRRRLLRYLFASPLFAAGAPGGWDWTGWFGAATASAPSSFAPQGATPIQSPDQALAVRDFEAAARAALPPAHFAYLATGVDDDATLQANEDGNIDSRFVHAGWLT
jgi:hypothetical protein